LDRDVAGDRRESVRAVRIILDTGIFDTGKEVAFLLQKDRVLVSFLFAWLIDAMRRVTSPGEQKSSAAWPP
jgi:hypothetical protein